MIGLPESYRFAIFNQTGAAISNGTNQPTPTISGRRVRFDSTGTLSYEAAEFRFFSNPASIGANSYIAGSTWSNTASAWLGGEFELSSFGASGCSGNLVVYLETSVDGGTTWPSPASANGAGGAIIVAVLGFASTTTASTASTVRVVAFEL